MPEIALSISLASSGSSTYLLRTTSRTPPKRLSWPYSSELCDVAEYVRDTLRTVVAQASTSINRKAAKAKPALRMRLDPFLWWRSIQ